MVPGMTERERLAADVRRLGWLADATLGPARIGCTPPTSVVALKPPPALPLGLWRRGLASARVLRQRMRLFQPSASATRPRPAPAPMR